MSARIPGRPAVDLTKTKLCLNFERGACTFGAKCKFAHGEHELRALVYALKSPSMGRPIQQRVPSPPQVGGLGGGDGGGDQYPSQISAREVPGRQNG